MSEGERTSDKEESEKEDGVRRRANFGQGRVVEGRWCPKASEFQTGKSRRRKVVSEVKQYSDNDRQINRIVSDEMAIIQMNNIKYNRNHLFFQLP
ncbi:hypothetical protein E1I69_17410 [Bacillus timonensis]|uniref:Uncharacterized protein n=1 Tax=Bacillus timonensis TaxID=1033734 RepID=A0A4S3PQ22_9BACI|nr:hypothetical protein [Bacillus timonensis]THE10832.1 hypothetical protein E1I69_17410 [Bacillus timonensis]